jgi:hypothetical protein
MDLDERCSKEPPAVVALVDLEWLGRKATDAAGGGCGSEYEETDND